MIFNVVARNQDDHVKNIAYLMDRGGTWSLAPAFDVTHAYREDSRWVGQHQMSINGKRDDFTVDDLEAAARVAGLPRGRARRITDEVTDVVRDWPSFAAEAEVDRTHIRAINPTLRVNLLRR